MTTNEETCRFTNKIDCKYKKLCNTNVYKYDSVRFDTKFNREKVLAKHDREIIGLDNEIKPVSIIQHQSFSSTSRVIDFLRTKGIKFKLVLHKSENKDTYKSFKNINNFIGRFFDISDMYFDIYISYNKDKLKEIEYDAHNNRDKFGQDLGYPKCCVVHNNRIENNYETFLTAISSIISTDGFICPLLINSDINSNFGILPYLPCTMNCSSSINIAQKYFKAFSNKNINKKRFFKNLKNPFTLGKEYQSQLFFEGYYKNGVLFYDRVIKLTEYDKEVDDRFSDGNKIKITTKEFLIYKKDTLIKKIKRNMDILLIPAITTKELFRLNEEQMVYWSKKLNNKHRDFDKNLEDNKKILDLKLLTSCNLTCSFCSMSKKMRKKNNLISFNEAKYELFKGREKRYNIISFNGGEPTIYPKLIELIKFGKRIGYSEICIVSNGIRFANKDYLKKIIEAGISNIIISFHANNKKERSLMGNPKETYVKQLKAIMNVLKFDEIILNINIVINKFNQNTFIKTVFELIKLGVRNINISLCLGQHFDDKELERLFPDPIESYKTIKKLFENVSNLKENNDLHIRFRGFPLCWSLQDFDKDNNVIDEYQQLESYYVNKDSSFKRVGIEKFGCKDCKLRSDCLFEFNSYVKIYPEIANLLKPF